MLGIKKGNKHSYYDFGVTIKSKVIGDAKKNKIKESVPFMHGSYDFSSLYGSQPYSERELKYIFNVTGSTKQSMTFKKIRLKNWLLEGEQQKFYDDAIPGYYFLAECVDTDFSESGNIGELTTVFTAYPFKIAEKEEGNNLWDDFNFELDILQDTKFDFVGTRNVTIHNLGSKEVIPTIISNSDIDIIKNGITYKIKSGTTKDSIFTLGVGANDLTLKGNGTIEFKFRKELL